MCVSINTDNLCCGTILELTTINEDAKSFTTLNTGESFQYWRRILNVSSLSTQYLSWLEIQGWTICDNHLKRATLELEEPQRKDKCSVCEKYNKKTRFVSCYTSPPLSSAVKKIIPIGIYDNSLF